MLNSQRPPSFHVILAQQLDRETIDTLCKLSEMIRNIAESRQGMQFLRSLLSPQASNALLHPTLNQDFSLLRLRLPDPGNDLR